ncbi:unconventional myosin-IXb-like isoform X2 [Acanthaster planci]|uniref:Unconventional myosin-IXb-like isoform X2 n=1 Tax=Acanthaster planci TaxID=133434 RepID=A0A8B7ZS64_ACAPL|nr:unconventional myosin-IXb-like isoform X2 [Acanthaster planci]
MSVANSFLLDRYLEELKHNMGNSSKASTDEVLLLREQLRTLSLEMMTLKHALNAKTTTGLPLPTTNCNGFTHIVPSPMQDPSYFDAYRDQRYSSSTHSPSCYSGCSCSPPSSGKGVALTLDPYNDLHDLTQMSGPLTEEAVLRALRHRWHNGECHTRVGSVLVSINPYRGVPLEHVLQHSRTNQSHHIQRIASHILKQLIDTGISQTVILGGESGSGKTHMSQSLLRQLYTIAGGGTETKSFKHLAASFTVLRSLGCAKTASNSDSSRIGYFIEVLLLDCAIYRTKLHCYWLDHSRVVRPRWGERNYHIFYQMLAGLSQDERVKLHLNSCSAHAFAYLNKSKADNTERDRIRFESWRSCLAVLGIPFFDVMRILAAVLLLGNVQFVEDGGYELDIKGNNEIKSVAALLGVSGVSLYRGLTTRTHSLKGQVFKTLCDAQMANQTRDVLAKTLYCRMVLTIVKRLNSLKRPSISHSSGSSDDTRINDLCIKPLRQSSPAPSKSSTNHSSSSHSSVGEGFIGIVDMFGFETTQCNRLEQLCMNHCSETLQQYYNQCIFSKMQATCREEDIQYDIQVEYKDNTPCLELLTMKDTGILSLLEKQTFKPTSDNHTLVQSINRTQQSNSVFQAEPDNEDMFTIKHFAGDVTYTANDFLEANHDVINDDVISIFQKHTCNFGFAGYLFAPELKALQGTSPKGFMFRISPSPPPSENSGKSEELASSLSQDFHVRLESLMKTLHQANPHFVRCIRSNEREEANCFDSEAVRRQVRHLQLPETVQLMAGGYPHQIRFPLFVRHYRFLVRHRKLKGLMEKAQEDCKVILDCFLQAMDQSKLPYISTRWALGTRHVFLSEEAWQCLEYLRDSRQLKAATLIQSLVRRWLCMKHWPTLKSVLQAKLINSKCIEYLDTEPIYEGIQSPPSSVGKTSEPDRCEAGIVEQTCNAYGLDVNHPPPIPKSRPYTVSGGIKVDFPQTRIMKCNFPDTCSEPLLVAGEPVLVTGVSATKGLLVVEHNSCTLHVPYQFTQVKTNGLTVGTKI